MLEQVEIAFFEDIEEGKKSGPNTKIRYVPAFSFNFPLYATLSSFPHYSF